MKLPAAAFAVLSSLLVHSVLATEDTNIQRYGIGKQQRNTQSGPSTVTTDSYSFYAFVDAREGGHVYGAQYTWAGNGGSPFSLESEDDGYSLETHFGSESLLNAGRPSNVNYTLSVNTTNSESWDYQLTLGLFTEGGYFPTVSPVVQSQGTWSNSKLQLSASAANNLGWDWASGFNSEISAILLRIADSSGETIFYRELKDSYVSGYTVPAGTLTAGQEYTLELSFLNAVDQETSDVPGATGIAYFSTQTNLTIQAVPEPSTYALLALGLGLVAWPVVRRRWSRG